MSQSSNHLRLVSWTWQWVHFTQMASTVTRSQSNRAPLGCGGTGDSHHGCAADKSAATTWIYRVNMDQNLWGMFPTPCWIYATKKLRAVLKAKGGPTRYLQGVSNKVASECVCVFCAVLDWYLANGICVLMGICSPFLCSEVGIKDCLRLLPRRALDYNHDSCPVTLLIMYMNKLTIKWII